MCVSVDDPLAPCITFSMRFILYQIWTTYINFKKYEEYLRELDLKQTDGQSDRQTNGMYKQFSNLLEGV